MHANRKPGNTRPPRKSAANSLPSIPLRITEDEALRPSQHSPPRPVGTAGGETANCLRFGSKHLPSLPACADQRPVKQPCAGPASSDLSTAALRSALLPCVYPSCRGCYLFLRQPRFSSIQDWSTSRGRLLYDGYRERGTGTWHVEC